MFRNPTTDLIVVLVIVLLIFGPKRLPGLGRQLGHGLREFKDSITGDSKDEDAEERPAIATTSATAPSPPPPPSSPPSAPGAGQAPSAESQQVEHRPAPDPVEHRPAEAQPAVGAPEQRSSESRS
jgi:sec-independent protein translocase protein TatA